MPATQTFSGTPGNADVGVDRRSGHRHRRLPARASSTTSTLTVANVNDAPTVANPIADQAATQDAAFSFTLPAGTFADVDAGDTLSYSATLVAAARCRPG